VPAGVVDAAATRLLRRLGGTGAGGVVGGLPTDPRFAGRTVLVAAVAAAPWLAVVGVGAVGLRRGLRRLSLPSLRSGDTTEMESTGEGNDNGGPDDGTPETDENDER